MSRGSFSRLTNLLVEPAVTPRGHGHVADLVGAFSPESRDRVLEACVRYRPRFDTLPKTTKRTSHRTRALWRIAGAGLEPATPAL